MPIYEMHCNGCGENFETIAKVDEDNIPCSICGATDTYKYISLTTHRHADHWVNDMMGAMHRSQERVQLKKEAEAQALTM